MMADALSLISNRGLLLLATVEHIVICNWWVVATYRRTLEVGQEEPKAKQQWRTARWGLEVRAAAADSTMRVDRAAAAHPNRCPPARRRTQPPSARRRRAGMEGRKIGAAAP